MDSSAAISMLRREAAAFGSLLRPDTLETPVRACPGWTVSDLARHLGGIHAWARHAVVFGAPCEVPAGPDDPSAIRAWFDAGAQRLVESLQACDPHQPCWSFAEPHEVRFWMRRQAHETAVHRWDLATSLGLPADLLDAEVVDGIDEVLTMFLPRQIRLGRLAPGPEMVELRCTSGETFTVTTAPRGDGVPDATIEGTADSLLLLLWKRIQLSDSRLAVAGSAAAAMRLMGQSLTP